MARWADARGLDVEWLEGTPGRPSVIVTARGRGPGRAPALLLNAHLDTVGVTGMPEPFAPSVRGGKLFGRGAMDMKASLAACLLAVADASRRGLAGDVILTAVADEEHDSIGTREAIEHLAATGVTPAAAIVTEPSDLQVHVAHRGFSVLEVEFTGKASHTSQPEAGVNALTHLGRLLQAVEGHALALRERGPHPLLGHGSLQPVLAAGGHELFTTPAEAKLTLERRTLPGETPESVAAEIDALLADLVAADPAVRATVRTLVAREPFEAAPGGDLVELVTRCALEETGSAPARVGAPYWTDAALIAAAGVPTLLYGPVGGGIHQADEWVDLASAGVVRRVLGRVAVAVCG